MLVKIPVGHDSKKTIDRVLEEYRVGYEMVEIITPKIGNGKLYTVEVNPEAHGIKPEGLPKLLQAYELNYTINDMPLTLSLRELPVERMRFLQLVIDGRTANDQCHKYSLTTTLRFSSLREGKPSEIHAVIEITPKPRSNYDSAVVHKALQEHVHKLCITLCTVCNILVQEPQRAFGLYTRYGPTHDITWERLCTVFGKDRTEVIRACGGDKTETRDNVTYFERHFTRGGQQCFLVAEPMPEWK